MRVDKPSFLEITFGLLLLIDEYGSLLGLLLRAFGTVNHLLKEK
jgi:hypothetical protein